MPQVSEEFRQAFIEGLLGKPAPQPTSEFEKRIFESIDRFVDNNHRLHRQMAGRKTMLTQLLTAIVILSGLILWQRGQNRKRYGIYPISKIYWAWYTKRLVMDHTLSMFRRGAVFPEPDPTPAHRFLSRKIGNDNN